MHFTLPPNERGLDELLGYYLALCYNKSLCSQNRSNGIITGTIHTLNIYTILFYVTYTELDEAICISHIHNIISLLNVEVCNSNREI